MPRYRKMLKHFLILFLIFYLLCFILPQWGALEDVEIENRLSLTKMIESTYDKSLDYKNLRHNVFTYSAYIDLRDGNMGVRQIRIMALVKRKLSLQCSFPSMFTNVTYYEMSENHSMRYKAFILSCQIPSDLDITKLKSFTIFSEDFDESIDVEVKGLIPRESQKIHKFKFTVCTPVLHGRKYSANYLIEFFEISRQLGADHIFVYVYSGDLTERKKKVLQYYKKAGLVTHIDVNLPANPKFIWNYGQQLVAQDCLYANMVLSQFTLFYDLDEHFVPYVENDWKSFSTLIFSNFTQAAYRIPTYYFPVRNISENLLALRNTMGGTAADYKLTKCLTKPHMIFEIGIHHVSRVVQDDFAVGLMNADTAAMHHFKSEKWYTPNREINSRLVDLIINVESKYYEVVNRLDIM